ncbi:MAG TPA: prolyl oligopeptidase family serine peptidase, partial [Candidatus Krumholzibacteria bacterium]|nr:prolyl oligopeptidase family serine peptidase [Candidatus Krumholzibacteria bacterium]
MSLRAVLTTCLLLAAASVFAQDAPHPFSVHDMLAMQRLGDPQVSFDGQWVAFTVRTTDVEANKGLTDIWVASVDGKTLKRLTTDAAADWNPRWCHDGGLFFLSTRGGSSQIWRIEPDGGEARQITHLALDINEFRVEPALKKFLVAMDVYPGAGIDGTVEKDAAKAAAKTTGLVYDELMFRHWDTWEDGKRSHLFTVDPLSGDAVDLMTYLDADVPTHPWGGFEEIAVTPDGREVLFTAKMLAGSEPAWSTDYDVYAVAADGSGTLRCLTEANEAWDTEPAFTPDGKSLTWLAMDRPGFEADNFHLMIMDWATGDTRRLDVAFTTPQLDRPIDLSPHGLAFASDNRTAYFSAGCLGQHSVFKLDLKSGKVARIHEMGSASSVTVLKKGLLFGLQHLQMPTELFTMGFDGKGVKQITDFNGARLAQAQMGEPEQFTFKGWNDETVYAYVVKPYDWTPEKAAAGQTWPVAFLVHGGPQGSFGNDFHYRWNPQAYVGAGFTTIAVDFHGSTGYGQGFTDAISGHWGDRPLEDLEKGLDAALAKYTWMDGSRVVAAGASYGGYMINWMHGQPFGDRFKALVCHDGNLDEQMAYFDTEE